MLNIRSASMYMVLAAMVSLAGCSGQQTREIRRMADIELSDEELFQKGQSLLERGKNLDARSTFRQLELRNPRGELAPKVKMAIADTYWGENSLESRVEAIAAYRSFLSFYPKHAEACRAQYNIAQYHFREMRKPDRDQTDTHNAIKELQKLLVSYPDCEYAAEAREKLDLCFERLAESELKKAEFYFKVKKNKTQAALGRYLYILDNYYSYSKRDQVLYRLYQIYRRMGKEEQMKAAIKQLITEYPESPWAQKFDVVRPGDQVAGDAP